MLSAATPVLAATFLALSLPQTDGRAVGTRFRAGEPPRAVPPQLPTGLA